MKRTFYACLAVSWVSVHVALPRTAVAHEPLRSYAVSVTVESGFWPRAAGTEITVRLPVEKLYDTLSRREQIIPESYRILRAEDRKEMSCRGVADAWGLNHALSFETDRDMQPLSSTGYRVSFSTRLHDVTRRLADYSGRKQAGADERSLAPHDAMSSRNPGFEEGDPRPSGWTIVRAELTKEGPHSGANCMRMTCDYKDSRGSGRNRLTSDVFPLLPNSRYVLSLWARGEKEDVNDVLLQARASFLDADGRPVKAKAEERILLSSRRFNRVTPEWKRFSAAGKTPAGTRFGRITIGIERAKGTLWVDDVGLTEPPSSRVVPPGVIFGDVKRLK